MAKQWAIQDQNQFPALIAHTGTAGTADTVRLVATEAGALTTSTSIALNSGTINTIGTVGSVVGVGTLSLVGTVRPGVGVADLGKQVLTASGTTDVGVSILGIRNAEDQHDANAADNQYARLSITDFRELRTRDQRAIDLEKCNATTGWSVFNDDAANIAVSYNHVFGTAALTFDKVNGTSNTTNAIIQKTITTVNVAEIFESGGFVGLCAYLPSLANVNNVFLRYGSDGTNFNQWTWGSSVLTAATWMNLRTSAASPDYANNGGNGWNPGAISYVAVGVGFAGETNTLSGIVVDHIHIVGGRVTATDISNSITSTVNTPNVNVQRVGGVNTTTGNGPVNTGVLRVTVANDSTGILGSITNVGTLKGIDSVAELVKGTVTNVGTVLGIAGGSLANIGVVHNAGTISSGSLTNIAMIHAGTHVHPTGTLTTGSLANLAMIHAGTVNVATGTVTAVTSVAEVVKGTTTLVTGVGTLGSISNVAVVHNAGTLATGSIANIAMIHAGTHVHPSGTITTIAAGTQNTLGTVGVVNNIVTGTLASVKINATPAGSTILTNHVLGTGGTAWGTLLASAGAGTNVYLTGVQIVGHSGTCDYAITNNVAGSTGAGVYARGFFPPGGGIARDFSPAINCGAAGTLAYLVNGNGTASFIVNYWVSP